MSDYPEAGFYRGLSNTSEIDDGGRGFVSETAFQFRANEDKEGMPLECSVNWRDDEGALRTIAAQRTHDRKTGEVRLQFRAGACGVSLAGFETIAGKSGGYLRYERDAMPADELNDANAYHGNLIFVAHDSDVSGGRPKGRDKKRQKELRIMLAYMANGTVVTRGQLDALL